MPPPRDPPPAGPIPAEPSTPSASVPGSQAASQPSRPGPRGFVAPGLTVLALGLTLVGGFQNLFRSEQAYGPQDRVVMTVSAWQATVSLPREPVITQPTAPVGMPLVLAAVVLAAAAIAGARYASTGYGGRLARGLTSGGAIFLTGVVTTIGMSGVPRTAWTTTIEIGMWLLIGSIVIAFAAATASYLLAPERSTNYATEAAYPTTPTPPSDVVITALASEPPPASPWAP